MPFSPETKARIFIRSARICCLCYKPCGTNVEAAHIIAEASGGPNTDDNAIPLCLDCHQEVGAYDLKHPRGNKFTPTELRARRDLLYKLLENGTLQAQLVAKWLQIFIGSGNLISLSAAEVEKALPTPNIPTDEAKTVLRSILEGDALESFSSKLKLLCETDRAYVLDALIQQSNENKPFLALMGVLSSGSLDGSQSLLLEPLLRKLTLSGNAYTKAQFMRLVPVELLKEAEQTLRTAFFLDVIGIMRRDQFKEVNAVTPAVVRVQAAIPRDILSMYLEALIAQAQSNARQGAPAAQSALRSLSSDIVPLALAALGLPALLNYNTYINEFVKEFIQSNKNFWSGERSRLYQDYLALDFVTFFEKHTKTG